MLSWTFHGLSQGHELFPASGRAGEGEGGTSLLLTRIPWHRVALTENCSQSACLHQVCFVNLRLQPGPAKALMFLENPGLTRHLPKQELIKGLPGCWLSRLSSQQTALRWISLDLSHSQSSALLGFSNGNSTFPQTLLPLFPDKPDLPSDEGPGIQHQLKSCENPK